VSAPRAVEDPPIRLGVSSCLLGNPVRFDGGHKRHCFVSDRLGDGFEWVPVCPELEAGLGVPRPAMHLVERRGQLQLVEVESGRDHTPRMERFATRRVGELRSLDLRGFVLKKDSPSCGMTRVEIQGAKGALRQEGRGLFAAALMEACPNLPVEEEGRLDDPSLRESFLARVFAYDRLLRSSP
jgi:uncharacterized protein YbbK (DUF523 family)